MRLRSCLMTVSMSFCLSLSVFRNWAKTLFFLLVSLILENRDKRENRGRNGATQGERSERSGRPHGKAQEREKSGMGRNQRRDTGPTGFDALCSVVRISFSIGNICVR